VSCPACQREPPEGSQFCNHCGAPLAIPCPSCGVSVPPGSRFCNACGRPLAERTTREIEREPRAYTPKHLVDKILQSKSALEGERKQVTVLFADVKGSMELAEQVDPEEWHAILDRFFEILTDGVHRFEGTVNQYTGDGIMALFGAPIAHEDHAQRACYAALHLRDALRGYADELRRARGLSLSTRIGLNSGEVVVGKIGDDLRMDYTAQGFTVGLAQRMEALAEPGTVFLTEHTARLVEGFFELRDLGKFDLKGSSVPLRVWELREVGALRTRLDVSRSRGFSRFVGRADEMATLDLALHQATQGHGQVVGVVGEAGVGKSRLCAEFVERCRSRGIAAYEAHCPAHGKTVPYLPLLELLRDLFDLSERDADRAAREKIAGRLLLLDREFERVLPLVFDLLGVSEPEREAPRMEPEARRRQLFAFVRRLVQTLSARDPVVVFMDDLHWIDPGSDAFLRQIVEAAIGTHTLVLVNFRPEYQADWTRKSHYQQLPLQPLGSEGIEALLRHLLGGDPSVAELLEPIRVRTGGNPFFIEEVVQSLAEAGSLVGARGAYRLASRSTDLALPATVQTVLSARIDRLPERDKRVLPTAAVIGKQFSEPILGAVTGLTLAELREALAGLREAEFVLEQALYPPAEYAFKHPLTQEVALGSQLREQRKRAHAAVAGALERAHAGELDERAALLAHHWEEAGEALEAARWHRRAAEWIGTLDLAAAQRHWECVRRHASELPSSTDVDALAFDAIRGLLNIGWRSGALPRSERSRLSREGRDLLRSRSDHRDLALPQILYAVGLGMVDGDLRSERKLLREVESMLPEAGDPRMLMFARHALQHPLIHEGRLREGLELSARNLARSPDVQPSMGVEFGQMPLVPHMMGYRSWFLAWAGQLGEARALARRGLEVAAECDSPELNGYLQFHVGECESLAGEVASARACANAFATIAADFANPLLTYHALEVAGSACLLERDWDGAISCLERALEIIHTEGPARPFEPRALAFLAEARLGLGEHARARSSAEQAIAASEALGTRVWQILGRLARSRAGVALGEAGERIDEELRRAERLIVETGAAVCRPHVHEIRARSHEGVGRVAEAGRELREAHRLFVEVGATGHAQRLAPEVGS
jgi:class 3 adenylate cyclase/tetratricopeptide (TPR) repeat protein